ncbi:MAG: HU family DNA-binding protein [Planctomycetota bacterium]
MTEHRVPTITKKDLINRIAEESGHTKVVVKDVLQRFLDEIVEELSLGKRIEFREFGVFEVKDRRARRAQNPRTLEKVEVPAKRVVRFKVGRMMRDRVCDVLPPGPETPSGTAGSPPSDAPPTEARSTDAGARSTDSPSNASPTEDPAAKRSAGKSPF